MYKDKELYYDIEITGQNNIKYSFNSFEDACLSINFSIEKTYTAQTNIGNFTIYNLSSDTRMSLKKTKLDTDLRNLQFSVGFDKNLYTIFDGTVKECFSNRSNTDFLTNVEGWDGAEAMYYSQTNRTINKDVNIYEILAKDLKDITIGYITPDAKYKLNCDRGIVLQGKTWELLKEYQEEFQIFIEDKKLYIYKQEEINQYVYYITTQNGVINTPKDFGGYIEVELILEPSIKLKNLIILELEGDKSYNGEYIVIGISHSGFISKNGGNSNYTTKLKLQKQIFK